MHRRRFIGFAASALALPAAAYASTPSDSIGAAFERFLRLPGEKSYLVHVGDGGTAGRFAHKPSRVLFNASAFKTFVLAQYLRDVESGRLSEKAQLAIDDGVRSLGSPVFIDLTGTTTARSVLEAMIAHSDNTATDAAMLQVGADRVRALIAEAELNAIRIPDSTRIFGSYIIGSPPGVDLGWPGILEAFKNPPGPLRPLINPVETMVGNPDDFVSWYERVLQGAFFTRPETLIEFKRIQAMSEQIVKAVPPDRPAYAKGGEVDFNEFNAKSFAGQMLVGQTPVTFCFMVNWTSPQNDFARIEAKFFRAIAGILGGIAESLD
jgi:beta-lactamase class A